MQATLYNSVSDLEPSLATYLAAHLCHCGSEMQRELYLRQADTPIAVVTVGRPHAFGKPVAWVASHEWQGLQTIEGFTDAEWRRLGLARVATCLLMSHSYLVRTEPVAVFAAECVTLARSLGFSEVHHYTRTPSGWRLHCG